MSKQEIAALSVRILALYIVVNAVVTTGLSTIPYIEQAVDLASIPTMFHREIIELLFPLVIAFLFWKFAHRLGSRMVKDFKPHNTKQSLSALELQTIIISVIGLFVAINSIPQFLIFLVTLSAPAIPESNFTTVLIQLVGPLLYLFMGWILLWNASRISHFLQRERA